MSVYAYTGQDADGRRRRGWIEAETPKLARLRLEQQGILTERLTGAASAASLGLEGRARVYRELGVLLRAGFTLERALGLLLEATWHLTHRFGALVVAASQALTPE